MTSVVLTGQPMCSSAASTSAVSGVAGMGRQSEVGGQWRRWVQ
jgi:hypothetical protein